MGETRLSDQTIKALAVPGAGNRITYDSEVSGFGLRVTAGGVKSFVLNYRVNGRERRLTIGKFPTWTATAARVEAGKLRRAIDGGRDPLADRVAEREAPTVEDLCNDYLSSPDAQRKRTVADDRRRIERAGGIRQQLGKLRVADVETKDIEDFRRGWPDAPYEANRQLALLSKMFSLAMQWKWRPDNPCRGITRFDEAKRERYLTVAELERLTRALADYPNQVAANVVRLLLLTGARRGEVLRATWDQFDLEGRQWTKPSSHTKQKKEHRVPLSPPAVQLLQRMQKYRKGGTLVFPGSKPDTPIGDIKKAWAAICGKAGLAERVAKRTKDGAIVETKKGRPVMIWKATARLHDLRHTYASILASSGQSLLMIGRLLGHTQAVTTERYSHFYDDPLREATNRVGRVVQAATRSTRGAKVIRLERRVAR